MPSPQASDFFAAGASVPAERFRAVRAHVARPASARQCCSIAWNPTKALSFHGLIARSSSGLCYSRPMIRRTLTCLLTLGLVACATQPSLPT
ncbi:hypothetical protein GS647_17035, partial [Xanthomonas hortorum pv. gardneri]